MDETTWRKKDNMELQTILFDLDGTITNPEEGITKSIQYALKHFGIFTEDLSVLRKHIGPPLKDGFAEFWNMDEQQVEIAVEKFREYFSEIGIKQNLEYAGIKELLEELHRKGKRLIIATSKPELFAKRILKDFGLSDYFEDICGSNMDETRTKKGEVIQYALEKNKVHPKDKVIMVGDRKHDIEGARENGIPGIGVLYGFGNREELEKAGAYQIAETVENLRNILLCQSVDV